MNMPMKKTHILLAEDDEHIRQGLVDTLESEGYQVSAVCNGQQALDRHAEERFHLVILDIMMPEISGLEVCERIKLTHPALPVLFLSAKNTSEDRVKGLRLGAEDYLNKPFNLEELLLRVNILIQRSLRSQTDTDEDTFEFSNFSINFATYKASTLLGEVQLTKKEALLLRLLIQKKNQVVSREEILERVWGYDVYPSTRTIDNFILDFRKYFEADSRNPLYFHSIRGVGYKFTCS